MRAVFSRPIAVAALCMSTAMSAVAQKIPSKNSAEPAATVASEAADKTSRSTSGLLSKPVVFRGMLGDTPIQAAVRPKEIADEGLEGEYFIFGSSQKILLAGELEGENLFLEESANGTSISGQWEGKLQGDTVRGTWMSADESVSKPFHLERIRSTASSSKSKPVQKARSAKSSTATALPAHTGS